MKRDQVLKTYVSADLLSRTDAVAENLGLSQSELLRRGLLSVLEELEELTNGTA